MGAKHVDRVSMGAYRYYGDGYTNNTTYTPYGFKHG